MKFYKSTNRSHPTHVLPSVLWSEQAGKALFEFTMVLKGNEFALMEFETEDPDLCRMLSDAGYMTQTAMERGAPAVLEPPVVMEIPLTEDQKMAFANRRIS